LVVGQTFHTEVEQHLGRELDHSIEGHILKLLKRSA